MCWKLCTPGPFLTGSGLFPVSVPHHTLPAPLRGIRHTGVPLHWHGRLSSDRRGIWRGLALHRCPLSADEGSEEWMGWGWEDLCRCCWSLVLLLLLTLLGWGGGQWACSIKYVFPDIQENEWACVWLCSLSATIYNTYMRVCVQASGCWGEGGCGLKL